MIPILSLPILTLLSNFFAFFSAPYHFAFPADIDILIIRAHSLCTRLPGLL
jgi:hypothetical protein